MKKYIYFFLLVVSFGMYAQNKSNKYLNSDRKILFNNDWFFSKENNNILVKELNYNDLSWRKLDLPHDWSIEDLSNQKAGVVQGPFSQNSIGKAATGWTVGGTGWYRKKFTTIEAWNNKIVSIHFDGVYMNSEVYLNGILLGTHPYGYTPFYFNLTPFLKPLGQENILAVKVENEGKNSRWYSGSGIYRDVCLTVTNNLAIEPFGVYITIPKVSKESASIVIKTTLSNQEIKPKKASLKTSIVSSQGKIVAEVKSELDIDANITKEYEQKIEIPNPDLWNINAAVLYKAITEVIDDNKVLDRVETSFGVRSIEFNSKKGFLLNGESVLLKGGCIHHDNGPIGAEAFARAEERKVEIMKKNGFNAIRTSHNPPSQHLLDACDRIGMLVIDEAFDTWVRPKNPDDYNVFFNQWWQKDLKAMIYRDRNHPSVIMWSIGNEIYEAPDLLGQELAEKLAKETKALDPTRPVTEAFVFLEPYTKQPWKNYQPHLKHIDVDGYNYFLEEKSIYFDRDSEIHNRFETEHNLNPEKVFYVSESLPNEALTNWNKIESTPYIIGAFKWTAFDYIGEAGLGKSRLRPKKRPIPGGMMGMGLFFKDDWPLFSSSSGDFDLIGNKKAASYFQDVVWRISPIEMLVHRPIPEDQKEAVAPWGFPEEIKSWNWTGQEGKKMQINVYSRSELVKLELNGKTIAQKPVLPGSITTSFEVEYQPGTLIAKGFTAGKQICSTELRTTEKAVKIRLVAEKKDIRADRGELCYVKVEIVDNRGNIVPNIDDLEVKYEISGDAEIYSVANGNGSDMSSFKQPVKKVYEGRGLVILRSNGVKGSATLQATANGVQAAKLKINIQ